MRNVATFCFSAAICLAVAQVEALPTATYARLSKKFNATGSATVEVNRARTATLPLPQFDYALLGQDPKDEHWYRISLTPTDTKSSYRAEFATRKMPPYNEREAHRHDKTIADLLYWLDRAEQHSLLKVYRQLLTSDPVEEYVLQDEGKCKRHAGNANEIETEELQHQMPVEDAAETMEKVQSKTNVTSTNNNSGVGNPFVYFIKELN